MATKVHNVSTDEPDPIVGAAGATYEKMLAEREPTPAESRNRTAGYDGNRREDADSDED